ncbi:alpha-L-rhamnosidase-related protein [Cohnella abietis]|uniref:Alpha-rhamnosidase n=1 Tax=Cohnella abietis TaxID=2507935 RepID=A0A3T1D7N8_9BACL|nr:family 78 glycoside hydrolase catalytic domain [Cohnella abietis]BBI34100.1 alpha-rhamnosidase [Cohnella abietis]
MDTAHQLNPTWISYPGDFELWLHREVSLRRDERLSIVPPFWRLDTHCSNVKFRKWVDLIQDEQVTCDVEGRYNIAINDRFVYGNPKSFTIPAGRHLIMISVIAETIVPAIYLEGQSFVSDSSWEVSTNNHVWLPAATLNYHTPLDKPSGYRLATKPIFPIAAERLNSLTKEESSQLIDFGKETFGYVRLHQITGYGKVCLYYGESREEALSRDFCETYDEVILDETILENEPAASTDPKDRIFTIPNSRAFRYVQIVSVGEVQYGEVSALYEYLPVKYRGHFRCSDDRINEIWDTSLYTLHLTTREFFLDGIKRDRWVWSGDACQSFLMNYYSFFDNDVCRRTFIALRGKDPVETHINHILDYSFYWILALQDYYLHTGDLSFVKDCYPKIVSLLQFCIERTNDSGFMEGLPDDWIFVDWGEMDNRGEVCFEQILFCRSLNVASDFATLFHDNENASSFRVRAQQLHESILHVFWDEKAGGLVHSRHDGKLSSHITKYANMFALSYGYFNEHQAELVKQNIMLNDAVQPIVTPYMRFYELASLCEIGETDFVTSEIQRYWGGMLDLGATSFWETFDPTQSGDQHYAMYGRPFGKSLCHSWGASPLYILGKYYLGVRPLTPGYETYVIEPKLGGLSWIEGAVPVPSGDIHVFANSHEINIQTVSGIGTLRFQSSVIPISSDGQIVDKGAGQYELMLSPHNSYNIRYTLG